MKVLVLYRPNSEYARIVEEFLHDLRSQSDLPDSSIQLVDVDTREGISLASIYDIMNVPAIVVTDDVGGYINSWVGHKLPRMSDVVAYAIQ